MTGTLVIQSHRMPLPHVWIERCLESVRAWAALCGYAYRFLDDELLDLMPAALRTKSRDQPVVAADLARLYAIRAALDEGFDAVVWCDADFLVFAPERLVVPDARYAFGREVWVQHKAGALRAYVKVHNAFMLFRLGNPLLDFYIHAAEKLLDRHQGPMAPQLLGPKFLTATHNIVQFPIVEEAAMLSPLVVADLLRGGGPALQLFLDRSPADAAGANLCASLVGREISNSDLTAAVEVMLGRKSLSFSAD